MENLITPFGSVLVSINNDVMEYQTIKLETNPILFPDIDGRYKLIVNYISDNKEHLISCIINDIDNSAIRRETESGERLECQSFYQDSKKLSIGIEFDIGYFNTFEQNSYDYDIRYLRNGMSYHILPSTDSHEFIFGIAWINNCTDATVVQTWYGADPTIM